MYDRAGPSDPHPDTNPLPSLGLLRARAHSPTRLYRHSVYTHIRTYIHTNAEGKCFSAPFRLCLARNAVENQYRETRKQRQGVDSNLCAGSIPVPLPLLAVPFSHCVSLLLCIPLTLSQFLSFSPSISPLSPFLFLSFSLVNSVPRALFVFTCYRS